MMATTLEATGYDSFVQGVAKDIRYNPEHRDGIILEHASLLVMYWLTSPNSKNTEVIKRLLDSDDLKELKTAYKFHNKSYVQQTVKYIGQQLANLL